jgi:hypothetical protein
MVASDPDLAEVVGEPTHYPGGTNEWKYVPRDGSFLPFDAEGGFNRYGWDAQDQRALEEVWPSESDALTEELSGT